MILASFLRRNSRDEFPLKNCIDKMSPLSPVDA